MDSADRRTRQGDKLFAQGRLDEAVRAYGAALIDDRSHVPGRLGLARLSIVLGRIDEAVANLDETLRRNPDDPRVLMLRGLVEEGRGNLEAALGLYQKAVAASPEDAVARYQHGRALCVARRFEQAIPELEAAASRAPKAISPVYALGVAFHESGKRSKAIQAFTRTLQMDQRFLDAYLTLADVLCEAGELTMAAKVLAQARSVMPDAAPVYDRLAAVRLKQKDPKGAVEALRTRASLLPDDEDTLVSLATVSLAAGDAAEAARAIDRLLARHPKSWRGLHLKSMLLDLGDRVDKAIDALREAHRLAPQQWRPANDLGSLLNSQAKADPKAAEEAVRVLETASALAPEERAPRFNLALAYWNAGRQQDARKTAQALVDGGPADDPVVRQGVAFLEALRKAGA